MDPAPGHRYHETFEQQYTRCGKETCHCMRGSQGHGPYWYAYWTDDRGRTRNRYVGKSLEGDAERQRRKAERRAREQEERRQREQEQEEARQREWQRRRRPPPHQSLDEADAAVLGVTVHVTRDELKSAYRRAAREHHPDRGGTHKRMTEINTAYERMKQRRGW